MENKLSKLRVLCHENGAYLDDSNKTQQLVFGIFVGEIFLMAMMTPNWMDSIFVIDW